jgi:hypothetical protein
MRWQSRSFGVAALRIPPENLDGGPLLLWSLVKQRTLSNAATTDGTRTSTLAVCAEAAPAAEMIGNGNGRTKGVESLETSQQGDFFGSA